ncbi:hypothetical protein PROFUN_08234 [Planoprotostelium fungivorum]|uniref:Uncharacterized protein n=1 Tax=Planoprotostelium fungivorum TaxID=1890364 RepID=A0A2P6NKC3_9EUKA|nr:hypothetical protein PROFUN_08234 [Planoprotostelium fungivorum]
MLLVSFAFETFSTPSELGHMFDTPQAERGTPTSSIDLQRVALVQFCNCRGFYRQGDVQFNG